MVPYVPGQKVASAAQSVLGAAYGLALRDPEIELPPACTQVRRRGSTRSAPAARRSSWPG